MNEKYRAYRAHDYNIPKKTLAWNLYGAGLDSMGENGKPEEFEVPEPNDDQILVRIDSVGVCFSDIKVVKQGPAHPKLYNRDMRKEPTRLGHEVSLTVVKVGKNLTDVPRTAWSVGLEYERGPFTGLLVARHVGHVFPSGDDMNRDTVEGVFGAYDAYTLVAARAGWRFDRHWSVSLAVDNLTDREYFVQYRQPGRTVYAELGYRF